MKPNNPNTPAPQDLNSFILALIEATENEGFVKAWQVDQANEKQFTITFGCKHYSTKGFDFTCEIKEKSLNSDLFPSDLEPYGQLSSFDGDFSTVDLKHIAEHICDFYQHIWTPDDDDSFDDSFDFDDDNSY